MKPTEAAAEPEASVDEPSSPMLRPKRYLLTARVAFASRLASCNFCESS